MAIKELITLEGVEEIEAKLARLNKAGEESLGQFRELGGAAGDTAFDKLVDGAQKAGLGLQAATGHTKLLSEAIHVLHPILQIAGVRMGELGSFARLAGAGIGALAVATAGAVAVGVGLLEEKVALLKGQLSDLTGSSATGVAAFDRLEQSAKAFGTTAEALAPSFTALKRGLDDFAQSSQGFKFVAFNPADLPSAQNLDNISKATDNFFKILRAGKLDSTEAAKASTDFFKAVAAGGKLSVDALKQLPDATIQLLAQAMGRGLISVSQFTAEVAKTPIQINKLTEALARFGPESDKAFDTQAIITMGDAFNKLLGTFSNFAKSVSGLTISEGIVQQIEKFRKGFVETVAQIQAFIDKAKEAGDIKIFGTTLVSFDKPATEKEAEKTGLDSAEAFKKGFRTAPKGDPVAVSDIVTIEAGSAADVIIGQFKEHFQAAAPATWEPLTKVPPFDLSQALSSFQSGIEQIIAIGQSGFERFKAIWNQPIQLNIQGRVGDISGIPFASGGMVRGRGTTTSDSILALLSNREFVVNARAVSHYGPDLFAALNAMRLPRDFISRFSMGGLARAISSNRFAAGGSVSTAGGNRSLTLVLDQKRFSVTGSKGTIDDLEREASLRGLAMIGKAPSWIR